MNKSSLLRREAAILSIRTSDMINNVARGARVEVEGGLYHVITRGNVRQDIFHSIVSRRRDSARQKAQRNRKPTFANELVAGKYYETVEESNARPLSF